MRPRFTNNVWVMINNTCATSVYKANPAGLQVNSASLYRSGYTENQAVSENCFSPCLPEETEVQLQIAFL